MGSKFCKIRTGSAELSSLELLQISPYTYNGRDDVSTIVLLSLGGSSSFLQAIRTTIKAWISLNFDLIPALIMELAVLVGLKI